MEPGKPKTKYNDQQLAEFKLLIEEKIRNARTELNELADSLSQAGSNGDDAAIAGKTLEDGSATLEKEQINQLAQSFPPRHQNKPRKTLVVHQ